MYTYIYTYIYIYTICVKLVFICHMCMDFFLNMHVCNIKIYYDAAEIDHILVLGAVTYMYMYIYM